MGGALHGDAVRVRVRARSARGAEGEIVEVIERGIKRVAGTLRRKGKSAWLEPDDTRMRGPIVLPRAIDAGGRGRQQRQRRRRGRRRDHALARAARREPRGAHRAVLGRPGELSVEVAKILVLEGIDEVHSEQAVAEAEAFGDEVPEEMARGPRGPAHLPLPTIDPEDARDHDDAVWVERTGRRRLRAWIAIADVSTYVRPARRSTTRRKERGCSVYLPDRAIPMLPRALSSNLCSLLPDVDRLCLCAEVELDAAGSVVQSRLVRGFMRSRAKLTYGGVARALGFSTEARQEPEAEAMVDGLRVADELSRVLRARRMKRGALDFELPEAKVILDERRASPSDVARRAEDPGVNKAYQLIEELMLLANEIVARWFRRAGRPDDLPRPRAARREEARSLRRDVRVARRSSSTSRTRATRRSSAICSSRSRITRWRRSSTRCSCAR